MLKLRWTTPELVWAKPHIKVLLLGTNLIAPPKNEVKIAAPKTSGVLDHPGEFWFEPPETGFCAEGETGGVADEASEMTL